MLGAQWCRQTAGSCVDSVNYDLLSAQPGTGATPTIKLEQVAQAYCAQCAATGAGAATIIP